MLLGAYQGLGRWCNLMGLQSVRDLGVLQAWSLGIRFRSHRRTACWCFFFLVFFSRQRRFLLFSRVGIPPWLATLFAGPPLRFGLASVCCCGRSVLEQVLSSHMSGLREELRQELRNLHVDMLRQFHSLQVGDLHHGVVNLQQCNQYGQTDDYRH